MLGGPPAQCGVHCLQMAGHLPSQKFLREREMMGAIFSSFFLGWRSSVEQRSIRSLPGLKGFVPGPGQCRRWAGETKAGAPGAPLTPACQPEVQTITTRAPSHRSNKGGSSPRGAQQGGAPRMQHPQGAREIRQNYLSALPSLWFAPKLN